MRPYASASAFSIFIFHYSLYLPITNILPYLPMKRLLYFVPAFILSLLIFVPVAGKKFIIESPDRQVKITVTFDKTHGKLGYQVSSRNKEVIKQSETGILTSRADFSAGLKLKRVSRQTIDETYALPQGKTSVYRNHANQLTLWLHKNSHDLQVIFRAYNDGIAFRYGIPGKGELEISGENSSISLSGEHFTFFGQNHPNRYGYESALGPVEGGRMSNPVLAHLKDRDHFILMGQAAAGGNYVQSHFQREGSEFRYSFPLDQEKVGPVVAKLPFTSPWRMVIISPGNPGKIVESYLVENLNPPTEPEYFNPDGTFKEWIRPGRVMWDFIAKDGDKPRMWIDAVADMGWEYYLADAGFVNKWGGADTVPEIVAYAARKNVGVIGWAHTREFDTREKAEKTMAQYAGWGLKGAKIDFFDHNTLSDNPKEWRDYEDTQPSLRMRDWILELGVKNSFLLELHGNTIPTGERRQYPNLMTLEGVDGMERRTKPAANDLTIPYVRNVMGPVSYTVIHFERSPGTHAYQLAMPVVYEAGLMIYAEHGQKLLDWPGREFIKDLPTDWDETRYIEGLPASHIVIARRKGSDWYIGGMTGDARKVTLSLDFLEGNKNYKALIFSDMNQAEMRRETKMVSKKDQLSLDLLPRGGFALRISLSEN
jgi:alpha-glucosidase